MLYFKKNLIQERLSLKLLDERLLNILNNEENSPLKRAIAGITLAPVRKTILLNKAFNNPEFDFNQWLFFNEFGRVRTFPIIILAFNLGYSLGLYSLSGQETFFLRLSVLYAYGLVMAYILKAPPRIIPKLWSIIHSIVSKNPLKLCGVIYIIKRNDGIIKIGKTIDLKMRVSSHERAYQAKFLVLSSWVVPNVDEYEQIALSMTSKYSYEEKNRKELRKMSDIELSNFVVDFTEIIQGTFYETRAI